MQHFCVGGVNAQTHVLRGVKVWINWYRQQWSAHIFGCGYCKYRMNCSATLDCGELVCCLFVLCHSQDDPPALCQEMEKGISGCSTLTKLSLHRLLTQCSSASVRAAMALQNSLTEVEWSYCDFYGKSNV